MSEKLVSIAMATYNGEKYLREQLDSIFNQTYKNIEVIVCDDCSIDNTKNILEEYKNKYNLIYYINENNLGVTKNFEKAISLSNGDFIALSDQDDVWVREKIEILIKNIDTSSLIYSDGEIIDDFSKQKGIAISEHYNLFGLDSSNSEVSKYLITNSFILGCSCLFKKELKEKILPIYSSSRNHDWWITYCANELNGIKFIKDKLIMYRHHNSNFSRQEKNIPLHKRITDFYSNDRKLKRRKKFEDFYEIINFLKSQQKISNQNKSFILDLYRLCVSFNSSRPHFLAFYYSIKYRKYLYIYKNKYIKVLHIISKLIG